MISFGQNLTNPTKHRVRANSCHVGRLARLHPPPPPKVVLRTPQVSKASGRAAYFIKKTGMTTFVIPAIYSW